MDIPLLLLMVGSIFLAGRIAERRGRSFRVWASIAAVIGPFALPAVFLLPNRRAADGDPSQGPEGPGTRAAPALQSRRPPSDHPGMPISRQASALSFSAAWAAK
jgi:hypothetical protein